MNRVFRWIANTIWWLVVVAVVLLAASVVTIKYTLPLANDYRQQIERNLTQIVGHPVSVGDIRAHLTGLDPIFSVQNIALQTGDTSSLRIASLDVRLNFLKTLLTLEPHFTYIRFIRPEISLTEMEGKWGVTGLNSASANTDVGVTRLLAYLLAQRQISILDARVNVQSSTYGEAVWTTESVYVQQTGRGLGLTTKLHHEQFEQPFDITVLMEPQRVGEGYIVNGVLKTPLLPIHSLASTQLPKAIRVLTARADIWWKLQTGKSLQAQGHLSIPQVALLNGTELAFDTHFNLRTDLAGYQTRLELQNFIAKDALQAQFAPIDAIVELDVREPNANVTLAISQLDLRLARLMAQDALPDNTFVKNFIQSMQLEGLVENARLRLPIADPMAFEFLGNFSQLSGKGFNGIPHISNLNGVLSLRGQQGYVEFVGKNALLGFPTLYDTVWQTQKLSGLVEWRQQQDAVVVTGSRLNFLRHQGEIDGSFRLEVRQNLEDWLMLELHGENIAIADRMDYIPSTALNAAVTNWMDSALSTGQVNSVDLVLHTGLGKGVNPHIRLGVEVEQAQVVFAPDWPPAREVSATLSFAQSGIRVDVHSAELANLTVNDIIVDLPFAAKSVNWLTVSGQIEDDVNDILSVLRSTNLSDSALSAFSSWQATGTAMGQFSVSIPFDEALGEPLAQLSLQFKENALKIGNLDLETFIEQGQLNFHSRRGISDSVFLVNVFGGQSRIHLTSPLSDLGMFIQADVEGQANVYQLLKWQKLPHSALNAISGSVDYQASMAINRQKVGQVDLTVESNLLGMAIDLPDPLYKAAFQPRPLTLSLSLAEEGMSIDVKNELINARIALLGGQVSAADIALNSPLSGATTIMDGVNIAGQLDNIDLLVWQQWLDANTVDAATPKHTQSTASLSEMLLIPTWLNSVQFIVNSLVVNAENTLNNVKIRYDKPSEAHSILLDSDEINVKFFNNGQRMRIDSDYFSWNTAQDDHDQQQTKSAPFQAKQVPNLQIVVDQLRLNNRSYGDWSIDIVNEGNRLRIQPISTALARGTFNGSVFWQDDGERSNVEFVLSIVGEDAAELTQKFSPVPFLTSKEYKIDVSMSWLGHPFYFDRESVSGRIVFNANKGKFTQVEELPPFLRALGIFNINALTRRLMLDFTDVYQPGLSYDTFKGGLTIQNGLISTTTPVEVMSPTAEITLAGTANLVTQTLDERLTASFPLGNTLPIAGLLLGAPQVAGLLYITDKLIGGQLAKVTSVQYQITGPFDSPAVNPVKFQPGER